MKRICVLAIGVLFLAGGLNAFADTDTSPVPISTVLGRSVVEVTVYNAYGVAIETTTSTTTTTKTTGPKRDGDGNIIWEVEDDPETPENEGVAATTSSTTVEEQIVTNTWQGGSLKVSEVRVNSTTTGDDGSVSYSEAVSTYTYDQTGRLLAFGTSQHAWGDRPFAYNESTGEWENTGSFDSTTEATYEIWNGQTVLKESHTITNNYSPIEQDGEKSLSSVVETFTTNTNEVRGGAWVVMESHSVTTVTGHGDQTGNNARTERVTAYQRNSDGVLTGMATSYVLCPRDENGEVILDAVYVNQNGDEIAIPSTGTYRIRTTGSGGGYIQVLTTPDQKLFPGEDIVTMAFDAREGWYVAKEILTWETIGDIPDDIDNGNDVPVPDWW